MLKDENKAIGNYLTNNDSLQIVPKGRDAMIMTIQTLHGKKKGYKQETMHLAGNIADRYLRYLAQNNKRAPNMDLLATISLLMAAKMEEPIVPCFEIMISLLPAPQKNIFTRQMLIDLEEKIVRALDFDFNYAGPLKFIERYQRLLSVDQVEKDSASKQIHHTSRQLLKYMQRRAEFLEYTPAHQASAALILSINICYSPASELIGLPRLGEKFTAPHEFENDEQLWVIHDESEIEVLNNDFNFISQQQEDPLSIWSKRIDNITNTRKELAPVYE